MRRWLMQSQGSKQGKAQETRVHMEDLDYGTNL